MIFLVKKARGQKVCKPKCVLSWGCPQAFRKGIPDCDNRNYHQACGKVFTTYLLTYHSCCENESWRRNHKSILPDIVSPAGNAHKMGTINLERTR
ncbi:hypothetical protein BaRGS_00018804 [Batillaria attramentaria]|uniref:Uncharacterized protein n=1 Tax=Batillaria attramentaria TaxID=370345 RepID=A0ABD0JMW1_9CAEN